MKLMEGMAKEAQLQKDLGELKKTLDQREAYLKILEAEMA